MCACVLLYIAVCDNGWLAMKVMLIVGIVSARFVLELEFLEDSFS